MADGRHFEKSKNRYIPTTVLPIAMNFGVLTHIDHINLDNRQKLPIMYIQESRELPFWKKNKKNPPYLANSSTDCNDLARWCTHLLAKIIQL